MELTKQNWKDLTNSIGSIVHGIGIKCPFCEEKRVCRIDGGIVELKCGTRIIIKPFIGNKHIISRKHNNEFVTELFECAY